MFSSIGSTTLDLSGLKVILFHFFFCRSSSPKTPGSPKPASPPGTPSAGGATANVVPPRQQQPQAAKKKQRPKKKKGGWWRLQPSDILTDWLAYASALALPWSLLVFVETGLGFFPVILNGFVLCLKTNTSIVILATTKRTGFRKGLHLFRQLVVETNANLQRMNADSLYSQQH